MKFIKLLVSLCLLISLTGCSMFMLQPSSNVASSGHGHKRIAPKEPSKSVLMSHYDEWKGTRYRMGGLSEKGVDCSGFVYLAYKNKLGIDLPRTTEKQMRIGSSVSKKNLKVGDLVFFKTGRKLRHVGIYVGDNEIIHASSSKGVIKSSLSNHYWQKKYWQARRVKAKEFL